MCHGGKFRVQKSRLINLVSFTGEKKKKKEKERREKFKMPSILD
jgi:hypothetical protein